MVSTIPMNLEYVSLDLETTGLHANSDKIIEKIWAMLTEAVENRDFPFHIPVFICGSKNNFDGRIVVLRGVDKKNRTIKFHSDVRSIKIKIINMFFLT